VKRLPDADTERGARVWLVRHAPTSWTGTRFCGRADPPLTAAGARAAAALGARLAAVLGPGAVIRTSPARRAAATAAAIATAVRAGAPRVDDRLVEVDFGAVEGLAWAEVGERYPDVAAITLRGGAVDWPEGETDRSVRRRAAAVWRDLTALVGGAASAPAVVVSHGVVLRAVLRVAGVSPPGHDADPDGPSPQGAGATWRVLEPASAVGLARVGASWHVVATVRSDTTTP
jgi:broad specificity phosphatase PhoE